MTALLLVALVVPLALAFLAQRRVQAEFTRYRAVPNHAGVSGGEGVIDGLDLGISLDELVSSVVQIKTFINPDGRTIGNLGRERQGEVLRRHADPDQRRAHRSARFATTGA